MCSSGVFRSMGNFAALFKPFSEEILQKLKIFAGPAFLSCFNNFVNATNPFIFTINDHLSLYSLPSGQLILYTVRYKQDLAHSLILFYVT